MTATERKLKLSPTDMDMLRLIQAGIRRSEPINGVCNYCKASHDEKGRLLCSWCTKLYLIGEEKRLQSAEGIYCFEKGTIGLCESCGEWAVEQYGEYLGKLKNYLPISLLRSEESLEEFGF